VTDSGDVFDGHKHCVEGAGHGEHQIFVKGLVDNGKDGFLAPIKKRPKNSMPVRARKPKAKSKRSEAPQRMLGAPGPTAPLNNRGSSAVPSSSCRGLALIEPMLSMPSAAASSQGPPLLHCNAASAGDARCLGQTGAGSRCSNPRKKGNYCLTHWRAAQGGKVLRELKASMAHAMAAAASRRAWEADAGREERDTRLAIFLSRG
jgi:hypothetical protein